MTRAHRTHQDATIRFKDGGKFRVSLWHHSLPDWKVTMYKVVKPSRTSLNRYCRLLRRAQLLGDSGVLVTPHSHGWTGEIWRHRSKLYTLGREVEDDS